MKTKLHRLKRVAVLLAALVCTGGAAIYAQEKPEKVGGTYLIGKAEHLEWVASRVHALVNPNNFEGDTLMLVNDIDMSGCTKWEPIGQAFTRGDLAMDIPFTDHPFCGSVDGQGYVIKNLKVSISTNVSDYSGGLFGYVRSSNNYRPVIRNLGIENFQLYFSVYTYEYGGRDYYPSTRGFGLLIGCSYSNVDIVNCFVDNSTLTVSDGPNTGYTGALIGYHSGNEIRNCFVKDSQVDCKSMGSTSHLYYRCNQGYVGGIAGRLNTATDCYVENSDIRSNRSHTGGIAGSAYMKLSNCFMTGNVIVEGGVRVYNCANTNTGQFVYLGGIVGGGDIPPLKNCYMTGNLIYQGNIPDVYNDKVQLDLPTYVLIGGLAGASRNSIYNSYVSGEIKVTEGTGHDVRFEVGGIVGQGGTQGYSPSIINSVFAGNLDIIQANRVTKGAIIGYYYSNYKDSDKRISGNYYTNPAYPAVGATKSEWESLAVNRQVDENLLLKAGFFLNEANWDYTSDKTSCYWSLRPYVYRDGQMPVLRRLVREHPSGPWDGRSLVMSPVSRDGKVHISNPTHLAWLANEASLGVTFEGVHVELENDLDLGGHYWPVIANHNGNNHTGDPSFRGIFNGNDRTVRNYELYEYEPRNSYRAIHAGGLFGTLRGASEINDLKIDNCKIKVEGIYTNNGHSYRALGALAGSVLDSLVTIRNCHVTNLQVTSAPTEKTNTFFLGGLLGMMDNGGVIDGCTASLTADVNVIDGGQATAVGGLVGRIYSTNVKRVGVTNCSASPRINTNTRYAGGLVGYISTNSPVTNGLKIDNCYTSDGSLRSVYYGGNTGGLIGYAVMPAGRIFRSWSSIPIEGRGYVAGFISFASGNESLLISECFSSGNVTIAAGQEGDKTAAQYGAGFVSQNIGAIIQDCYSIGDVISKSKIGTSDFLGGFESHSGRVLTLQNCYAAGRISALESKATTKYLGAFSARTLTNVVNSFADCEVITEEMAKFYFNGLFGDPGYSTIYKTFDSYHPYSGKRYGTETDPVSFRTPAFFTDPANWTDTTIVIGAAKIPYATKEWDPSVWLFEEGCYPVLKNLDHAVQVNPKRVNRLNVTVLSDDTSAEITWEKLPDAHSYLVKVYADPGCTILLAELKYDEEGNRLRSDEKEITVRVDELEEGATYYYTLSAYAENELLLAEFESRFTVGGNSIGAIDVSTISVYPNPTDGRFVIDGCEGVSDIVVTTLSGTVVYTAKEEGVRIPVDITRCPSGIYLLKVRSEHGLSTCKVVRK